MAEEYIFEEVDKRETANAGKSSSTFKSFVPGNYRNLREELKAKCAPEIFMNPYDPRKVAIANEIFWRVQSLPADSDKELKTLRSRMVNELGVKVSTEQLYKELTDVCNPIKYTKQSYNKVMLDLANRLYQMVLSNADDYLVLERIRYEAAPLIAMRRNREEKMEKEKKKQKQMQIDDFANFVILTIGMIVLFVTLCVLLAGTGTH